MLATMKAHEVLKRYADGRRDFSGENLRGQSFKGKDLSGANFSEADIRSANFTNAKLTGANFTGAKAGLQRRWFAFLHITSFFLKELSIFIPLLAGFTAMIAPISLDAMPTLIPVKELSIELPHDYNIVLSIAIFLGFLSCIWIFCISTIKHGFTEALVVLVRSGAILITLLLGILFNFAVWNGKSIKAAIFLGIINSLFLIASFVLISFASMILAFTQTLHDAMSEKERGGVDVSYIIIFGYLLFQIRGIPGKPLLIFLGVSSITYLILALAANISRMSFLGHSNFHLMHSTAINFSATGGTSFRNADLTDADFTSATLKSTDFRGATLTRTRWHKARKLDRIRPGTTYLQFPQVRQLLITGQGQAQNFDRQPLRGINLKGANLADASFIGADLSEANLQDADLSRAKLVQTQLDETDLTGATLTGAYIEDWGITSHTKLDGVRCEYVFMRLPTKEDPNPRRKPDNWNETFKDGDFADFIKPIVDTLDLYHNQDVDPRAIAISFKQLAENHPEAELEIVAMEKRGGNKFLLRAATAPDANHSKLNAEYFDTYNEIKALAERELQALLKEKDNRISSLENMIATALQRPSFYAETYQNQGVIMSDRKTEGDNISISGGNLTGFGSLTGDNTGTVSVTQNTYHSEQRQTLAEAAAEIQELLKQLEQSNPTATEVEQKAFLTAVIPATKRERFVNALQAGGKELFKELMDNMYVNVAVAAIEGWQSAE
jgi:uncharacterized protein YjbI with pentapeptide repeats